MFAHGSRLSECASGAQGLNQDKKKKAKSEEEELL
jgi:hypothetical protein